MRKRRVIKMIKSIGISVVLTMGLAVNVFAINKPDTLFMSPNFGETNDLPSNVTSTPDVWYEVWGYGNNLNLLNLNGLDAAVAEGLSIGKPKGTRDDCVGIYVQGEDLSADNINAMANAGWSRLDVYYKTYMIGSYMDTTDTTFAPRITTVSDPRIDNLLKRTGYTEPYGLINIEGITLKNLYMIYYEAAFSFLNNTPTIYKYRPTVNCFEYVGQGWHNSYGKDFIDVDGLPFIDGEYDGIYMFVNGKLPEGLLSEQRAESFINSELPQEEIGEISLEINEQGEIKIDIPYTGELPASSTLVVKLPGEKTYDNGTTLYLYYVNDQGTHDFVAQAECKDGWVNFPLEHCSEYIITDINHGQNYTYEVPTEAETETTSANEEETSTDRIEEKNTDNIKETPEDKTESTAEEVENAKAGNGWVVGIMIALAVVIIGGITVILVKKKK